MTTRRVVYRLLMLAAVSILSGILAAAGQNSPQTGTAKSSGSINNEDCAVCHEDLAKAFDRNPHAILEKSPRYNLKNSCESCHGPGEDHASNSGDKAKIIGFRGTAHKAFNDRCLSCHAKSADVHSFPATLHAKSGLACSECHRVHSPARSTRLLREAPNNLCLSCHLTQRADFSKPFHHRVRENAMRCLDCHQPHSGIDRRLSRISSAGDSPCVRCHIDKEGPFAFEHPALRVRGCAACHEPHGSNNPKMLVRSSIYSLCLECHSSSKRVLTAQPPSFHDIRSPRYRNCTTCHVKIHGSNSSPIFLR